MYYYVSSPVPRPGGTMVSKGGLAPAHRNSDLLAWPLIYPPRASVVFRESAWNTRRAKYTWALSERQACPPSPVRQQKDPGDCGVRLSSGNSTGHVLNLLHTEFSLASRDFRAHNKSKSPLENRRNLTSTKLLVCRGRVLNFSLFSTVWTKKKKS